MKKMAPLRLKVTGVDAIVDQHYNRYFTVLTLMDVFKLSAEEAKAVLLEVLKA